MDYKEFIENKKIQFQASGFDVNNFNTAMFDWQRDITRWALKKGKAALFEDCGLGKTLQQLEWSQKVCEHTGGDVLILSPLAVAFQTQNEGLKFGYDVTVCRSQQDIKPGINITNYENIDKFDPEHFKGIVLDESSILKHQDSKTRIFLIDAFRDTPYKLCCTATPSPNDYIEFGGHCEFLGIMSQAEMLATFFIHDGGDTSKWRLKGHAEDKFWEWLASWACVVRNPKDIGYDGGGYDIPPLNVHDHVVKSENHTHDDGQMSMFAIEAHTLSERRNARKDSIKERVALAAEIANNLNEQVLIWCDTNAESDALTKAIVGAVEVKGSDSNDHKSNSMMAFSDGKIKALVSKPSIAGWGMNWQNCSKMIFVGLSDSFESYYQAVRRCWRFGQENEVDVHIIISDAEGAVRENIERKQQQADKIMNEMAERTSEKLKHDIHQTVRISDEYHAMENMMIPEWIEEFKYD